MYVGIYVCTYVFPEKLNINSQITKTFVLKNILLLYSIIPTRKIVSHPRNLYFINFSHTVLNIKKRSFNKIFNNSVNF